MTTVQRQHNPREFSAAWNYGPAQRRRQIREAWAPGQALYSAPVLVYRLEHKDTGAGPFGWSDAGRSAERILASGGAYHGPSPYDGPAGGIASDEEICGVADWQSFNRWFGACDHQALADLGFCAAAYLAEAPACTYPDRWGQVIFDRRWAVRVERYEIRAFADGNVVLLEGCA